MRKWLRRITINRILKRAAILSAQRESNAVPDAMIQKEIGLYMQLVSLFEKSKFDKKLPHAKLQRQESLRAAASLGSTQAQYILSQDFFDLGRFWHAILQTPLKAQVQYDYSAQCFKEALAFVTAAENHGHILAKRLHGLAYINGWGLEIDSDKGFQLVIDSIDEENAWDRVTKIFEEIGLNKPEFFSKMMQMRKGKV